MAAFNQTAAHALLLEIGVHRQRRQRQGGFAADADFGKQNIAGKPPFYFGHLRQGRHKAAALAQGGHQILLFAITMLGRGKCGLHQPVNSGVIIGGFAADIHMPAF